MGILERVARRELTPEQAAAEIQALPLADLGFAQVDLDRVRRCAIPEVIFCQGKTAAQVSAIIARMKGEGQNVLATRATPEMYEVIRRDHPDAVYHSQARCVTVDVAPRPRLKGQAAVVCAGTSDLPVAEEAAVTAEWLGARVDRITDVGVAGLHRLMRHLERLRAADAIVVVAGMEGALPSVVAGLVSCPVIAVPTSIGYGAHFNGLAPLLTMLNSCAPGVMVVNIDNGFGAGVAAARICKLRGES